MKILLKKTIAINVIITICMLTLINFIGFSQTINYPIVGTNQTISYDSTRIISKPVPGQPYYGQNSNYPGNVPSYSNNGDGTVTDNLTGLMWQKSPDKNGDGVINYSDKLSYSEALAGASKFRLGGYNDWRLPTIKELYSLILFTGLDPDPQSTSSSGLNPFIDTTYFKFGYGDLSAGERIIDGNFVSSTRSVSKTCGEAVDAVFGVNFADGRIKGYPIIFPGKLTTNYFYIRYVRGNTEYGKNKLIDNSNGTISDNATGLMWMQNDNAKALNWENALSFAENFQFAGYSDWRLPNTKELQSIVDYTRSPKATNSPAIDPVFNCTKIKNEANIDDYPCYWSNTSHISMMGGGRSAAYICFGRGMGYMPEFGGWSDVHGAGCQRSDPKVGNASDFPNGRGPQGDAIRILNYVRLVRNITASNKAPEIPSTPDGSIKGDINNEYQYKTSTTDIDGDSIAYFFDWADGTNSGWSSFSASGKEVIGKHTWKSTGDYKIKVKAKDIKNSESGWSDELLVKIEEIIPDSTFAYKIVGTGQNNCYDTIKVISAPQKGSPFYGQDAQFTSNKASYTDNGNGTITDNVTGLMWQKSPEFNNDGIINSFDKKTYSDALSAADTFKLAGYNDWRLPTIKELYSLFLANGTDPSGPSSPQSIPFIDTKYFPFAFGDTVNGERQIDAQYATSTIYVGKVFETMTAMFGVNFADGRIKGYGLLGPGGQQMKYYVKYVRGYKNYGINVFIDNKNGTITDKATNLMWSQSDSRIGMNWENALAWVAQQNASSYLGYNDWRMPNVKELQSIIDYTKSPTTSNSAAIDSLFECTKITVEEGNTNYPFYWSSTTHASAGGQGGAAMYVCFGQAFGFMEFPPNSGNRTFTDVHGAGAQRSDPKWGNPADFPTGRGPQGDVIRINNFVRLVRDADASTGVNDRPKPKYNFGLEQNYPNPFSVITTFNYYISAPGIISIKLFDAMGNEIATLVNQFQQEGYHNVSINSEELNLINGVYFYRLNAGNITETRTMILSK